VYFFPDVATSHNLFCGEKLPLNYTKMVDLKTEDCEDISLELGLLHNVYIMFLVCVLLLYVFLS